ncbi:MAG: alanine racemase [Gammaproteobacteria bacterium]|jgi:diaminopimelate decarboxylase
MGDVILKQWQRPSISPHRSGIVNKFGDNRHSAFQSTIDGIEVEQLIAKYGSPLFVLSERKLRDNVRRVKRAFSTRYPKVRYAWSYKTNYLNAVCSVFHQEGAWAEVVSDFEYEKARALGVPGTHILFNGPYKPRAALERAVQEQAMIHIDHMDELYLLEEVAHKARKQVPVAIRINFDTGYTEPWSRFGFNLESGEALDAARRIAASSHLKLTGLHSHIGTFILDVRAYAAQARIMAGFMEEVENETGCRIQSLDIGGGFASRNVLQGTYLPAEQVVPSIEQYAESITTTLMQTMRGREASGKGLPALVLESGRSVVDDAESLITSVVGTKRLADGRRAIIVDAGVNLLFTGFWYNHDFKPTTPLHGIAEETVLYGPLCMNIDCVRHTIMLPPLNPGDLLVVNPVGAYNNTQWLQFIQYRPNIVMVHEDDDISVVRSAEDLSVVNAQELLPPHLSTPYPAGLPE